MKLHPIASFQQDPKEVIMKKTKVYISGKITGLELSEAMAIFEAKERELCEAGHEVINPFKIHGTEQKTWEGYMLTDIEHLFGCHEIHMLPNWKQSKGARIEHAIAEQMEMTIVYHV